MSMDKILSSIYTIIFISCLLTGILTFWVTSWYIKSQNDIYYVVDVKRIVDFLRREYILVSYQNPKEDSSLSIEKKFKMLSSMLLEFDRPIFEKGAIVNERSANVVDLTPLFMKKLGLVEEKDGK